MSDYDGRLWVLSTTFASRDQAEAIILELVSQGLVACGQVGAELTSFFHWQGKVECESEVAAILKVRDDRYAACVERLRELHPYEVPQLVAWPAARVDVAYGRWAWEAESCE